MTLQRLAGAVTAYGLLAVALAPVVLVINSLPG